MVKSHFFFMSTGCPWLMLSKIHWAFWTLMNLFFSL